MVAGGIISTGGTRAFLLARQKGAPQVILATILRQNYADGGLSQLAGRALFNGATKRGISLHQLQPHPMLDVVNHGTVTTLP